MQQLKIEVSQRHPAHTNKSQMLPSISVSISRHIWTSTLTGTRHTEIHCDTDLESFEWHLYYSVLDSEVKDNMVEDW